MNLQEFEKNFGTEKQCLDYLYNLRWANGYCCSRCKHNENWEIADYKYKCKKCGYQTTVISGTLLQDTHIPIYIWFKAVWHITSSENKITALSLQKQLSLNSNRTALLMLNKLRYTMFSKRQDKLRGKIEVYWEFQNGSNNQLYYLITAVEINNKQIGRIKIQRVDSRDNKKINEFIESSIETGSHILCKKLHGLDKLVSKGYILKVKSDRYSFPYADKVNIKFKNWLRENRNNEKIKLSYNVFACDYFCKEFNKYKTIPSFEEILYNAMHLPPKPYAKNEAKK